MTRYFPGALALALWLPALWADEPKGPSPSPGEQFRAIVKDEEQQEAQLMRAYGETKDPAEREKGFARYGQLVQSTMARCFALVEKHPQDPVAVDALELIVIKLAPPTSPEMKRAIALLQRDHLTSSKLSTTCEFLARRHVPDGIAFLQAVLDKNPSSVVHGRASLCLALLYQALADEAAFQKDSARMRQEAEKYFDVTIRQYGDMHWGDQTLAEKARVGLHEMRHLTVGQPALEIRGQDSDSREFKLSDYRGKVVVLDFWAKWCPKCTRLVPQQRALVERLADKPFVLLGVNLDESREQCRKAEQEERITWRSWFDGQNGPIAKQWNINLGGLPMIYILDPNGIIRYKGIAGPEIDKAVESLLKAKG